MKTATTDADRKKLERLKRLRHLQRYYKLFEYTPYEKQKTFHGAGKTYRERCFMAGNQLGKCCIYDTNIDTPNGVVKVQNLLDGDTVFAWNGEKKVEARAWQAFRKEGLHECALIVMSDGRSIGVADHHRILTASGYALVSDCLPESFFVHPLSIAVRNLKARVSGAARWIQKAQDSLGRCFGDFYPCDERPHVAQDNGQAFVPLRGDVLLHSGQTLYVDGQGHTDKRSPSRQCARRSSQDVLRLNAARCVGWLTSIAYRLAAPNPQKRLIVRLLSIAANFALRSIGAVAHPVLRSSSQKISPWQTPNVDGCHIIAIIPIGRHEIWDFTVPEYANYCASGLVHHNTLSAAAETAMHATGLYPDWWDGMRFHGATRGWVASKNADVVRDGAQRLLYGPITAPGTGMIPKDRIVDKKMARGVPNAIESLTVMHASGDLSEIKFKGYSDGREAWQAETLDYVWYDEEPPEDIYVEGLTRTNNTGGGVYLTFTPLLGMSSVVMRFRAEHPDRVLINMQIEDVGHYSEEQKRKIIEGYPPHERDARAKGIPMLGEGRIFQIAEEMISEPPLIEVPEHWRQIVGLDFGWSHPTAAVRIAYEPENDVVHVVSAYRQDQQTPIIHAAAIKPWGTWIPVAWPRDGLQTDKGSGDQLAAIYRQQGLYLLSEFAQFPDKRGVGVEAGLLEMCQRMQTGRLKVGSHLDKWWEEFRMYHRKDGKIVDLHEDLICATRYAIMMLRYSQSAWDQSSRDRWADDRRPRRTWMSA